MTLVLHYGNAVTGAQRFPRPELEARFLRTLKTSVGVKMFGLRRIGKSTLRLYAMEKLKEENRPFAYVDGQGLHSIGDLLGRLLAVMPDEGSWMRRALGSIGGGPVKAALDALVQGTDYEERTLSAYWRLVSDAIKTVLGDGRDRPVLIVDEFTYLLHNMIERDPQQGRDNADKLLASLREWRGEGLTMLLTGSIGLTGLARRHKLNVEHLNDLQPFDVPELTEQEARAFILQATEGPPQGRWTDAHTEEFLKECAVFYPCFLVRGLLEIGVDHPAAVEQIPDIFATRVRPDLHADFYNQFDRRFAEYKDLPHNERDALILPTLTAVMTANPRCQHNVIPCKDPFTQVDLALALKMLVEDGYLRFHEDRDGNRLWEPASRLARSWWKRSKLA